MGLKPIVMIAYLPFALVITLNKIVTFIPSGC